MNHFFQSSTPATEDALKRRISYLRISITDRCNLRCSYCMPPKGLGFWKREEFLSNQELFCLVCIFTRLGVRKVRLTGGETLLRPDLEEIIQFLHLDPNIKDISISTNGVYLPQRAYEDKGGPLAAEMLARSGFLIEHQEIIPTKDHCSERLADLCDQLMPDIILTLGSTGLSSRDIAPEATLAWGCRPARQHVDRESPRKALCGWRRVNATYSGVNTRL